MGLFLKLSRGLYLNAPLFMSAGAWHARQLDEPVAASVIWMIAVFWQCAVIMSCFEEAGRVA